MRITSLGALLVCACSLAAPVQAVVLECEVKGKLTSWLELFDTEKETGWKQDGYSYRKTERINLNKPNDKGVTYKEVDISVSRYSGNVMILTTDSNGALVHRAEGHCQGFKPEDRKF